MPDLKGRLLVAAVLVVLLSAVFACGDDDNPADEVSTAVGEVTGAEEQLCGSIDDLESAVGDVGDLDSSSTVDEARDASSEVQSALDGVKEAASGVVSAAVTALETAFNALQTAINNVSGEDTLGDAASQIESQQETITNAVDGLKDTAGCS